VVGHISVNGVGHVSANGDGPHPHGNAMIAKGCGDAGEDS